MSHDPNSLPDGRAAVRHGDTVINVASRLRELIYDGVYRPGEHLRQSELAEQLEVGRTPLREAVRMLEAEGLLASTANRGVTVSPMELGSGEELYAIRLLIEPPLAAALVDEITPEELAKMEELLHEAATLEDRHKDFQRVHRAFHDVQLEHYSPAAREMVHQLHRRVHWHQRVYMSRPQVPADFLDVDWKLVEAIKRRDSGAARAISELHLLDAAIGLVLDVEPDHLFGPLLTAAQGSGIDVDAEADGSISRPVRVRWANRTPALPPITTNNIRCDRSGQAGATP